ncbi:glycyl-radical enzyme activating protein [Acetonema longum]|uniref:Pyruvate formate-lyase n=1 Tax=Acetonema longum DSM 6540 TaxID=1009370 RepID=F7NKS0_9FIRM|nr:glycyl-radical enzyme activating protein [Acetonema longum]EGO63374.1 pyruvate formate-lyase [Acetonema longum DSM 6540]
MQSVSGTIFQIQRWSINDGEGIRSTVFLKGCPLRCQWCANPESWHGNPEVLFLQEKCTGCGQCAVVCDAAAVRIDPVSRKAVTSGACLGCGKCCQVCAGGARKQIGMRVTVDDVMKIIQRDAVFYRESGGGVTFSGGEPFLQAEFLRQLVLACGRIGLDTAVETCGFYDWQQVADIFAHLNCVFIDCKHMDDAIHRKWTGVGNQRILENIQRISQLPLRTIVRVPLIREVNANEQNIREMCRFLVQKTGVREVELLAYHDYGKSKHHAAGLPDITFSALGEAETDRLKQIIADYGITLADFK